jgi:hypothetical protein
MPVPLLAHLGARLQNLRQRQRKSLKKRNLIPGWCQLRRSCLDDLVGQLVLGLSQENMGLRGRCMNKETIQSTHGLQHLMIQTAKYCSKTLTYLTGADFLRQEHIVFISTVGMRLQTIIVDTCIQWEPVTIVSEILN